MQRCWVVLVVVVHFVLGRCRLEFEVTIEVVRSIVYVVVCVIVSNSPCSDSKQLWFVLVTWG